MTDPSRLRPIVPPGAYLADSLDGNGRKRALLFDSKSGAMLGPPELEEVEDDDYYEYSSDHEGETSDRPLTQEEIEALAVMIVVVGTILVEVTKLAIVGVRKGTPIVKRWWRTVRSRFERPAATPTLSQDEPGSVVPVDVRKVSATEFSDEMGIALTKYRNSMSRAEAEQRRLAISAAEAFIAAQKKKLDESRIDDTQYFDELNGAVERLQARELPSGIPLMLESSASSESETSALPYDLYPIKKDDPDDGDLALKL